MDRLSSYMKSHLVAHIKKEMEHGYSMEAIKDVLLNYHHNNIIDEAIAQLDKENFSVRHKTSHSKKLDKELFHHVVGLLQDYIKKQKKRGYSVAHIRQALLRYGHADMTVRSAIDAVEHGKTPQFEEPFNYGRFRTAMFPLGVIAFLFFVMWLSIAVQESPVNIGIFFSPILLTVFLLQALYKGAKNKQGLLAIPIVLVVLCYFAMQTGASIFTGVEAEKINGLSFLVSFFYSFLYVGSSPGQGPRVDHNAHFEKMVEEQFTPLQVKKVAKKSSADIEKQIEEDIASGKHGLTPVTLPKKKS